MKINQGRMKLNLRQMVISYLLITNILLMGLPTSTIAQKPEADDALKMNGKKVNLKTSTNKKISKMSAQSFSALTTLATENNSGIAKTKSSGGSQMVYAVLNVEFTTAVARKAVFSDLKVSKIKNAFVLTAFDRFADVFVSTDAAWDALSLNPNVVRVEFDAEVTAPPPPKVEPSTLVSQAVPESIIRGGYKGLTGKNVIIAVLDTGIDFRHPDFMTKDANGRPTSRIAYLWDTATDYQTGRGTPSPVKFPNGTSVGTLYTKAQLTNELRSTQKTIPATDEDGHGTACASVAAGNGSADKQTKLYKLKEVEGVAPEADIIGVRLGKDGLENSYLLNAIVEWLEKVAGKTPLVISGSFGGHYTGHDGQSISERHLNARFPLTKAGRAVVFAAGNEGNDGIHAKVNFAKDAKLVSWTASRATLVRVYFNSNDGNTMVSGTQSTPLGQNMEVELNPITKQYSATIEVKAGTGGIWLENTAGKPIEAHLYFYDSYYGTFSPESVSYSHLVGAPGSMENAITVGSYDWNDNFHAGGRITYLQSVCRDNKTGQRMPFEIGYLSCYSSRGPNRNGVVKPDIVSPGEWFASADAKSGGNSAGDWAETDSTGFYRKMNGTSAATPYTSGVIALMFQKKPTLTLGEIKNLLKANSSKSPLNPLSKAIPNNEWGYGKLDWTAVEKIFAAL